MPQIKITTNYELKEKQNELVNDLYLIVEKCLTIKPVANLILIDEKLEGFYSAPGTEGNCALVEFYLFPGKSTDAKRDLYTAVVDVFEKYGVKKMNTRITIIETERENWGIRGGKMAADLDM